MPENIIKIDEGFNRYMQLISDVCVDKEGVSYRHLFGDVKLPPLYPVMNFSEFRIIKSVVIEEGVEEIGYYAFKGCSSLKEIEIPEGVEEIGECAFYDCSSLQKIEIPEGVKEIGKSAFYDCSSLNEIAIPQYVMDIGDNAFKGGTGLESVTIGINFINDIQRIFGDIDSKIIHFI